MAVAARVGGVPSVRLSSRLQVAASFIPQSPSSSSTRRGGRRGGSAEGPPPALTADVRVVIRRHFPVVGPRGTRIVQKIAEDIALRRRPSRELRGPDRVERALAEDVIPLVDHPFDRGAVVAASREICAHVAAACADPRIASGGVRVLALVDTFACPLVFRLRPPCKPMWSSGAVKNVTIIARADDQRTGLELESGLPAAKEQPGPIRVIGDTRPKPVEERFEAWLPW
ncbi:hypothetical protein BAE44_0017790 [Dichanthelium oligosanthes]|uniref:Uncharacterized protein n=1 Tax=Dichanthelium oligosanthes TaxID=888268 RepID=A0A1E5V7Q1_9POAL|nr:hypothetical protein BAE44_0017790 [Dichanthelium oligosanthes]